MDKAMVTAQTTSRIEIDVIRHNSFYFYNRRENGRDVATAERITRDRAEEIIGANQGASSYHTGNIRFDDGPYEFSWTVTVEDFNGSH